MLRSKAMYLRRLRRSWRSCPCPRNARQTDATRVSFLQRQSRRPRRRRNCPRNPASLSRRPALTPRLAETPHAAIPAGICPRLVHGDTAARRAGHVGPPSLLLSLSRARVSQKPCRIARREDARCRLMMMMHGARATLAAPANR